MEADRRLRPWSRWSSPTRLVANVVERPDGLRIGALFILGILIVSFVSRLRRSFEIRATSVTFDDDRARVPARGGGLRRDPPRGQRARRRRREGVPRRRRRTERHDSHIPGRASIIFLEVEKTDSSDFEEDLRRARRRPARVPGARGRERQRAEHDRDRAAADPQPHRRRARTSTSSGRRATRSRTWCGSSSPARARSRRSPGRCCARPSRTSAAARWSTSADPVALWWADVILAPAGSWRSTERASTIP